MADWLLRPSSSLKHLMKQYAFRDFRVVLPDLEKTHGFLM